MGTRFALILVDEQTKEHIVYRGEASRVAADILELDCFSPDRDYYNQPEFRITEILLEETLPPCKADVNGDKIRRKCRKVRIENAD